jgi:non-canonical purine NTP pyrophosphatase (RdgB/HAM1 family)
VELASVIFVTNNEGKHREVERLLAGLQIRFQRMDLAGHEGATGVEELARLRVTEAYARLKQPCFVESTGLFLWDHPNELGVKFKRTLRDLGEAELARRFGGSRGVARVAVAYEDGTGPRVFSGSISGTLLRDPRGEGGYGWDRIWVPDGYERTLAEMQSSKFVVNMRAAAYLELGDQLRGETSAGTFEAHVTVGPCDLDAFRAACTELGVKCISIELSRGETKHQPMTGSFHHGEVVGVHGEVMELARGLAKRGFDVTRTKIERHGHLERTTPETDAAAALAPATNYFEYHVKLVPPPDADLTALGSRLAPLGAHLSRNARNESGERFVTLRVRAGRLTAEKRFAELLAMIAELRLEVRSRIREYTVVDSNLDLDKGWLP